jgi:hypothetical protein
MNSRENASTELEYFKTNINLVEFAMHQFGYMVDTKKSSENSIVIRKGEHEKLIVTRDIDGHYVYFAPLTPVNNDSGSIIDFIQARMSLTLGQVRLLLRFYQGASYPKLSEKAARLVSAIKPVNKNTLAVLKAYEGYKDLETSNYLESRGLRKEIYTSRRFYSKIRVDKRSNLIFPHFDKQGICGFERKNRNFLSFSAGGKKAIWSSNRYANDERLVIAEAVIDALSYHALFGNEQTRYASTSGAWSDTTKQMIWVAAKALPKACGKVVLAYDNDKEGDKYRSATHKILKGSGKEVIDHLPQKKDFNEDIKDIAQ